jgi:mannose-6-phosphate isomerase-like protein (cupin superfamily)
MKFSVNQMMERLPLPANEKWKHGIWDVEPFEKKGVRLVFFAPRGKDFQTSHEEDELYFIVRGSGEIVIGDEIFTFEAGDAFFVAANVEHKFIDFTDDFATWAIFF